MKKSWLCLGIAVICVCFIALTQDKMLGTMVALCAYSIYVATYD